MKKNIDYIELFSGIGAFSQAIKRINNVNAKCVFATDIDLNCYEVYMKNYGIDSLCDITLVSENDIPIHNFCFFSPPCQTFSKSGKQLGFEETRGTLIYDVFRILKAHKPKYILMENVRNLVSHDNGRTIKVIMDKLHELGYRTTEVPLILSPHYFGIPQTRERAFLPGIYDPMNAEKTLKIKFDNFYKKEECNLDDIINHEYDSDESLRITKQEETVLEAWDEFHSLLNEKTIGFPIWFDYFYNLNATGDMPNWKIDFISKNKKLYNNNKEKIDAWVKKYNNLRNFTPTQRKFEWQAGDKISSIWEGIIQIRPSGVRVKAPTTLPALVAIVQIPIIGKLKRRLSVQECAKLQSFPEKFDFLDKGKNIAYRQLGNSINVTVLNAILEKLLNYEE